MAAIVFAGSLALANSEPEAKPAEGGEHGASAATGSPKKNFREQDMKSLSIEVMTLKGKVKAKKDSIKKLMQSAGMSGAAFDEMEAGGHGSEPANKGGEHGAAAEHGAPAEGGGHGAPAEGKHGAAGAVEESVFALVQSEYRELQKLVKEYDQKKTVLKYRYPELGKEIDRKYKRIENTTLTEIGAEEGVDVQLETVWKKVQAAYSTKEGRGPANQQDSPSFDSRPFAEPIIFSK